MDIDLVLRQPQAGEGPVTSTDQFVLTYIAATGKWGGRAIPVTPPSVAGVSVSARATTEANGMLIAATANFVAITGGDFVQDDTGTGWTFNPVSCVWTYSGAVGKRYLVELVTCAHPNGAHLLDSDLVQGVDFNGDLIGTASPANQAMGVIEQMWFATFDVSNKCVGLSQRYITPFPGDTVQPCYGRDAAAPQNYTITRLSMTITEVGND